METIGQRLMRLRMARGLTQQQAAELFKLDHSTISAYEKDTRLPTMETLVLFARAYHVTTDYLLGIKNGKVINADGLTEREYLIISELVQELMSKNEELTHTKK
jgi:transcriptional regulator with XRE-family HTH domain